MLVSAMLVGCLLLAPADAKAPPAKADLKPAVDRLIRQLDLPHLADREAAERELLGLGPDVLDLLPADSKRLSAEAQQRLARLRQRFQEMTARSAAEPSRITLKADAMPLSKCLAELTRQSGNAIVDFRENFGEEKTDPPLKVNFDKTVFWEALDKVLDQAKLTVYPFGPERAIHVVTRPPTAVAAGPGAFLRGPFRFLPLELVGRRDLDDPADASLQLKMLVSWEPRLAPISLKQPLKSVEAIDSQGRPMSVQGRESELEVPVQPTAVAVELTVPMALPPRDVSQISRLAGVLDAVLPGREATFRFDKLTEAQNVTKRVAGVTVTLERVRKNGEIWEVWVGIQFDQADTALESHRGWVFNNPAYLEGPDGKPIQHDGFETTRRTETEVGLAYLFDLKEPPTNLTFVYKTPSAILSAKFPYEFKNLPLP